MPDPAVLAASLARAHHQPVDGLPTGPLLVDVAESPREDDWTLRSALVRFAQPEPVRAGAVLELVRRTDGALKPHRRRLEATLVPTHPELGYGDDSFDTRANDPFDTGADGRGGVRADARASDLGRLLARHPDGEAVVAAYTRSEGLGDDEVAAAWLLAVAVELDAIAGTLAAWAHHRDGPPPVEPVDQHAARARARLEALGVPREEGPPRPPPGARRRG